jgi:hypothetical protein
MTRIRWTKWISVGLALVVCVACAPRNIKMDHDGFAALKSGPPLKLARYKPAGFSVVHPGNSFVDSLFGVSGGELVMPGQGAGDPPMDEEFALDDPAMTVRDKVFERLAFEMDLKSEPIDKPLSPEADDPKDLRGLVGSEGWLLDIQTTRWGLAYDTKLQTRYRTQVEARGRLIDLAHERVAWEATCDGSERDAPKKSTLGDLKAGDAAALRERLTAAAERCADELVEHLFAQVR